MSLTIRARLTLMYFVVLGASFAAFFWICDFGFRRSIEITVNDASRSNLERVRGVIEKALPEGIPKVHRELTELSALWASGALFEVAGPNDEWIFQPAVPKATSAFSGADVGGNFVSDHEPGFFAVPRGAPEVHSRRPDFSDRCRGAYRAI